MKKILIPMILMISFFCFSQNKIVIVSGSNVKIYTVSAKDIVNSIKKDAKIRQQGVDVLMGYENLKGLDVSKYNAVVIINANLTSGYNSEVDTFLKASADKSKILLLSFYKGLVIDQPRIETSPDFGVDSVTSTTVRRLEPKVDEKIKEFILSKI